MVAIPGTGKDRSLADAVGLPGEDTRGSDAEQLPGEEQESVDTLTVFDTDSSDAVELGALIDRSGQDIGNPGLALVVSGDGDSRSVEQLLAQDELSALLLPTRFELDRA